MQYDLLNFRFFRISRAGESCIKIQEYPPQARCRTYQHPYDYSASKGVLKYLCEENYYPSKTGNGCQRQADMGIRCDSPEGCLNPKGLICMDGHCQCNTTKSFHDSGNNICIPKAGWICSFKPSQNKNLRYIENTYCTKTITSDVQHYSKLCDCDHRYFQGVNGTCEPKRLHGKECSLDYK